MSSQLLLRVIAVRSQNPNGFGGCIFTGKPIQPDGEVSDAKAYVVVKASFDVIGGVLVQPGQWWQVKGPVETRKRPVDGYVLSELQINADEAALARPSGEHLVRFMAENSAFEGIGEVKARKLWDAFGERLYQLLDAGDASSLGIALTPEIAAKAVAAWAEQGDSRTLQWLQLEGFDFRLARKVLRFFGKETKARLDEDPYRLLSFCARWGEVDRLAQKHFKVQRDDPRRLQGAIEEACYRIFVEGHTAALSSTLMDRLASILGPQTGALKWRDLIHRALSQGLTNGSYVIGHHGLQPLGALVMERQVAEAVANRLAMPDQSLFSGTLVDTLIADYEASEGLELNQEQRQAIQMAASNAMMLITGGAGVGKTTVLKALYKVYDCAGCEVVQLALAGRAAKRMQEATGRASSTIANFLRRTTPLSERCVVVVDEASMVDIITMSRLCQCLGVGTRLVLVGDPSQLMPVGPGLVLHALATVSAIPHVELKVVKRYGGLIAAAATDMRCGKWPELSDDETAPIAFLPCAAEDIGTVALRLYQQDPESTQMLSARRNGLEGTKGLNTLCQAALTADSPVMLAWDVQHDCVVRTVFHLGDIVLCTRNLWDIGLQNGSLGVLVEVADATAVRPGTPQRSSLILGWVEWDDGKRRPVTEEMLDDFELGYAITVHKAQGSQWPRIIVTLTGNRILDRTLVYTAVTRAQRQVLLVGDPVATQYAVETPPSVTRRSVALDLHLRRLLEEKELH